MKNFIKCLTCGDVMGFVEKDEFNAEDEAMYQQMMTCPNGHSAQGVLEPAPIEG